MGQALSKAKGATYPIPQTHLHHGGTEAQRGSAATKRGTAVPAVTVTGGTPVPHRARCPRHVHASRPPRWSPDTPPHRLSAGFRGSVNLFWREGRAGETLLARVVTGAKYETLGHMRKSGEAPTAILAVPGSFFDPG
jgi:hypothetical protein